LKGVSSPSARSPLLVRARGSALFTTKVPYLACRRLSRATAQFIRPGLNRIGAALAGADVDRPSIVETKILPSPPPGMSRLLDASTARSTIDLP
jgi:hypothetical protein